MATTRTRPIIWNAGEDITEADMRNFELKYGGNEQMREDLSKMREDMSKMREDLSKMREDLNKMRVEGQKVVYWDQLTAPGDPVQVEFLDQLTAPAEQLTAPAEQLTAPAEQLTAPADQLTAPADQLTAPAEQLTAPVLQDLAKFPIESDTQLNQLEDEIKTNVHHPRQGTSSPRYILIN